MFEMIPFIKNNSLRTRSDYFNYLFDDVFKNNMLSNLYLDNFKVDVKETENDYIIDADLPGIKKENISVDYNQGYLTLRAKHGNFTEDKNDNYIRRERCYSEFKRTFYINNIKPEEIYAKFTNGVLTINLPKKIEGINKKTIEIH